MLAAGSGKESFETTGGRKAGDGGGWWVVGGRRGGGGGRTEKRESIFQADILVREGEDRGEKDEGAKKNEKK